ncbi:MAG: sigma-70 family RNA polymerase sigma factor [Pirellulaceae bacterium]
MSHQQPHPPITSASLLLRIRDPNDHDSWQEFESIYGPFLRAWCQRKGVNDSNADDIVQEVLAIVARSIHRFEYQREKGGFRAWLATVASRKLRRHLNGRATRTESISTLAPAWEENLVDADSDWLELFSTHVFKAACDRVRGSFSPQTWQCFEATWLANREASEVAETIGIPLHSVFVNKSRVLKRLELEVRLLADDLPLFGDRSNGLMTRSVNAKPVSMDST